MFDFYNYVNSPDVSRHLREIGYAFTAAEAAWVVYYSRRATLEEKHRAYNAIIDELPDDRCVEGGVHASLRALMAAENEAVARFKCDEPSSFSYAFMLPTHQMTDSDAVFTTFEECTAEAFGDASSLHTVQIRKKRFGRDGGCVVLTLRVADGAPMRVAELRYGENSIDVPPFCDVTPDLPLLFQPGDILYAPRDGGYTENVVFEGLHRTKDGRLSDGELRGQTVQADGLLCDLGFGAETYRLYTDFEYVPTMGRREVFDWIGGAFKPTLLEEALWLYRCYARGMIDAAALCRQYGELRLKTAATGDLAYHTKLWGAPFVKIWVDPKEEAPYGYEWFLRPAEALHYIEECKKEGVTVALLDLADYRTPAAPTPRKSPALIWDESDIASLLEAAEDTDVRFHSGNIADSWRLKRRKNSHDEE